MLTNLDWLREGQQYPPAQEKERMELYRINEALFLTQHDEAWGDKFTELARRLKKSTQEVDTIFNYQQLLSKKTADFVCGEPPDIEMKEGGDDIDYLLRKQQFFQKLYEAFIDVSRFGNGVLKVVEDRISVVSPKYWFPIVDPTDLKRITHDVIAYPTDPDADNKPTKLYVEIHGEGKVRVRWYAYDSGTIGALIEKESEMPNELPFSAVQPLYNITHSGSIYGLDDYTIVNSLIAKLMWRIARADSIMDKHSEPSMSGPDSALEYDEEFHTYYLNLANYFSRKNKEDPDVSYITWDGNLEANFQEIEMLFNQIYILSEMGTAFMEGGGAGEASSGTALKLRLVSPRIKASRLVGINDATVRHLIALLGKVNGIEVDPNTFQLNWKDGLPDDPTEDASRRSIETGGKATKSQFSAIKERGLSDEDAQEELEQIMREEAGQTPYPLLYAGSTREEEVDTTEEEVV